VPQILQLAHLVEQHGMAKVQIRRGRVETRLDAQRAARCKPLFQFVFKQQFMGAALDLSQRIGLYFFWLCHFSHVRYQLKKSSYPQITQIT